MTFDQVISRFIEVEQALGIRRSVVLFTTLWMTWKSFDWAAQYAYVVMVKADNNLMLASAGLVVAVTGPIAYLQKVVFEAYITSRAPTADTLTTTTTIRSEPPKA